MGSSGLRKQLLCQILDETADRKPDQLFCIHPISPDISQGWRRVTMADLAGAVNYTAWWIERTIGQGNSSEPLAYMGARDLRYATFAFACMKTGHSVSGRLYPVYCRLGYSDQIKGALPFSQKFRDGVSACPQRDKIFQVFLQCRAAESR